MQIRFFKALWGMEHLPHDDAFRQIKAAGYDGVELGPRWCTPQQLQALPALLAGHGLDLIAQQYTWEASPEGHLQSLESQFRVNAGLQPLFINSHTGKDHYPFALNGRFIRRVEELSAETGVKVVHETHRGRFTCSTTATEPYLDAFPALRLCADFSHWVCVAESYLEDQEAVVAKAIRRTDHLHARVGFHQGPQVNDPRAPEWAEALRVHLAWWDRIVAHHRALGAASLTITPEFGPFPYMPALPYTRQPVTDLWEINLWMKDLLKERYGP